MYNKSEICKRANLLIRKGHNRSDVFNMAWAEAKNAVVTADTETVTTTEVITVSDIVTKAREFKEIQTAIAELEAKANAIKESIISDMDGAEEVKADIFKIRYITVTSNRFNTAEFKKAYTELYNQYTKENVCKRFTVSA